MTENFNQQNENVNPVQNSGSVLPNQNTVNQNMQFENKAVNPQQVPYPQCPPYNQAQNFGFNNQIPPNPNAVGFNPNMPPQFTPNMPNNAQMPYSNMYPNGQYAAPPIPQFANVNPQYNANFPAPLPQFPNAMNFEPEKVRPENENYAQEELGESKPTPKIKGSVAYICVTLIVLALFAVGIFALGYFGIIKPDSPETMTQLSSRPVDGEMYTIEEIGEYIRPSVVEIYCFSERVSGGVIDSSLAYASGSGVIISDDGYIVTNQHVISDAVQIEVIVYDKEQENSENNESYTAKVVGYDTKTDLAVIRIDATNLVAAELGDAEQAVLGEQVIAIGNPSGYAGTMTAGIISGLNRKIRTEATGYHMTCIQTDAPISPGNSGGALVNMYGQVIGITSSKIADTTVEGIGFAITVNEAKPIIDDIIEFGYVRGRYRVGIEFYGGFYDEMYDVEGLYITGIREDSDVYNTELAVGDVITEVNGVKVTDYDTLTEALEGCVAGDVVNAKVVRINEDTSVDEFEIEFELVEDTSGDY